MGKKKKIYENLTITEEIITGKFVAKLEDRNILVDDAIPGDVVDVKITGKKSSNYKGRVIRTEKLSPMRTTAICEHFGICGGCKWQNLNYAQQLQYKQQQVAYAFRHLTPPTESIIGHCQTEHYRNKLEFSFGARRWLLDTDEQNIADTRGLGFHVAKRFDRIVDIDNCYLQPSPSNEIRSKVKEYALANDLTYYNANTHEGFLRTLVIRTSTLQEVMVIVILAYEDLEQQNKLLSYIHEQFPQITSLMYIINEKKDDSYLDLPVHLFAGQDHIFEQLGKLKFKVRPQSFFQVNPIQTNNLYNVVLQWGEFCGKELVYDLYCGTGSISSFIAHSVKHVVGIEYVETAITDAQENAKLNNIDNTSFVAGNMEKVLNSDFFDKYGKPDVVITDPPRAGMHAKVVEAIIQTRPQKIIYVSCNPVSQARDIGLLRDYQVVKMQPVDMFPHTPHIENVALLKLTEEKAQE